MLDDSRNSLEGCLEFARASNAVWIFTLDISKSWDGTNRKILVSYGWAMHEGCLLRARTALPLQFADQACRFCGSSQSANLLGVLTEESSPRGLFHSSLLASPILPCPYGRARTARPYVPARTSLHVRAMPHCLCGPCSYGPARAALRMALPARPCSYGSPVIPCLRLSVRPCPCNPGHTALAVQPWLYDPGCAALAVQPCSYGPGRGALAV